MLVLPYFAPARMSCKELLFSPVIVCPWLTLSSDMCHIAPGKSCPDLNYFPVGSRSGGGETMMGCHLRAAPPVAAEAKR